MKPGTFKLLRTIHRWAGLFFAPLIVLFALSGLLQTLHADDWAMPQWLVNALYALEDAHQDQQMTGGTALRPVAAALIVAMATTLIVSTAIGVVMAYVMYPKRRVLMTVVLILGVVAPAVVMLV